MIREVRSGAQVTATVTAPVVGAVIEDDSTVFDDCPYPPTPQSVVNDILTEAATVRGWLDQIRLVAAQDLQQSLVIFAAAKLHEQDELTNARAVLGASNQTLLSQRIQEMQNAKSHTVQELAALRSMLAEVIYQARAASDAALSNLQDRRNQIRDLRQSSYDRILMGRASTIDALDVADVALAAALPQVQSAATAAALQRDAQWSQFEQQLLISSYYGWRHAPPPQPSSSGNFSEDPTGAASQFGYFMSVWEHYAWQGGNDAPVDLTDRVLNVGTTIGRGMAVIGGVGLLVTVAAPAVATFLGATTCAVVGHVMTTLGTAMTVAHYWDTYNNWGTMTDFEKDQAIGGGILDVATIGLGKLLETFCFTEDTDVRVESTDGAVWYASSGVIMVVTMGGVLLLLHRRRRRNAVAAPEDECLLDVLDEFGEAPERGSATRSAHGDECDAARHVVFEETDQRPWCSALIAGPNWSPVVMAGSCGSMANSAGKVLKESTHDRQSRRHRASVSSFRSPCRGRRLEWQSTPHEAVRTPRDRLVRPRIGTGMPWSTLWIIAGLLLAAFCGWRGYRQAHQVQQPLAQVRVGDRIAGRNPLREQVEDVEPDAATWRKISLYMAKPDGLALWIELLRPVDWIEARGALPGRTIHIDLSEMGALGEAHVTNLGPCPPIRPGEGTVVTGTFKHQAGKNTHVVRLKLEGQQELTGVTNNHPYWSVDRQEFVEVGRLRVGEIVDTMDGQTHVVSVTPVEHNGFLYNLETTEHVYRVGLLGTLVHNSCIKLHDIIPYSQRAPGFQKHHGLLDQWAAANKLPNYLKEAAPTIVMTAAEHNATRRVFGQWRFERTGSINGAIDWSQVSPREMQSLSNQMLEAANLPQAVQDSYMQALIRFLYTGSF